MPRIRRSKHKKSLKSRRNYRKMKKIKGGSEPIGNFYVPAATPPWTTAIAPQGNVDVTKGKLQYFTGEYPVNLHHQKEKYNFIEAVFKHTKENTITTATYLSHFVGLNGHVVYIYYDKGTYMYNGNDKIISNEQTEYTNLLEAYNKKQAAEAEAQAQAKASKKKPTTPHDW